MSHNNLNYNVCQHEDRFVCILGTRRTPELLLYLQPYHLVVCADQKLFLQLRRKH